MKENSEKSTLPPKILGFKEKMQNKFSKLGLLY